jgi:hypothetical protein
MIALNPNACPRYAKDLLTSLTQGADSTTIERRALFPHASELG